VTVDLSNRHRTSAIGIQDLNLKFAHACMCACERMLDDNLPPLQQPGSLLPVVCNALEFSFWMYIGIMLLDVGMVVEFSHMSLGLGLWSGVGSTVLSVSVHVSRCRAVLVTQLSRLHGYVWASLPIDTRAAVLDIRESATSVCVSFKESTR
jgi:hypothetical protein